MGMAGYKKIDMKAEETDSIFAGFPDIDAAACTERTNQLFKPYLFFRWKRGHDEVELWSSCCRRHGRLENPPRTMSGTEMAILWGKHNDETVCPWCGKTVTLKERSRLGKKKKLLEFQPVVILKAGDGALYARAYWARKDYQGELDAPPLFFLVGAYAFRKGSADMITPDWFRERYLRAHLEGNYDPVHRVITEPFQRDCNYGYTYEPYTVLGLEEIGRSDFRYCQYERFRSELQRDCWPEEEALHWHLMKYLAAAAIYPNQIEMLMKSGFREIVEDLVRGRRKDSKVFDWKATDYLKAFRLSRQEMREWRESGAGWELIGEYRLLRDKKLRTSFADLREFRKSFGNWTEEALRCCRKRKIKPMRLGAYLSKYCGGCHHGGRRDIIWAWEHWHDYIHMAGELGWDLTEESVLLPSDLFGKHDEAAMELAARNARLTAERLAEEKKRARKNMEKRMLKYNFQMGDFFIRVAECEGEILLEGKTLQHCVGGYAQRHMQGVTTILFLRRTAAPDTSLYTIEMDGNRLVQIHGFQNERNGEESPRKTMAWMLEPWLDWLKKRSPRKKDGSPKLPEGKEKSAA